MPNAPPPGDKHLSGCGFHAGLPEGYTTHLSPLPAAGYNSKCYHECSDPPQHSNQQLRPPDAYPPAPTKREQTIFHASKYCCSLIPPVQAASAEDRETVPTLSFGAVCRLADASEKAP